MNKTNLIAFKQKCYWCYNEISREWHLSDYKGWVYKNAQGFWLKHPTGFTKISRSDIVGGTPQTHSELDFMGEYEQMI